MTGSNELKCTSFNTVKPANQLIVRDSNTWNTVWGLITAYYWASYPSVEEEWAKVADKLSDKDKDQVSTEEIEFAIQELNQEFSGDKFLAYAIYQEQKKHGRNINSPSILFYLLNQVGVKNIAYDSSDSTVVLLSYEPKPINGEPSDLYPQPEEDIPSSVTLEGYGYPYIVKLRIATSLPNPHYNHEAAFHSQINHWSEITGNLIIKLPPLDIEEQANTANISPAEALSHFTAFVPYYPFGFQFTNEYDSPIHGVENSGGLTLPDMQTETRIQVGDSGTFSSLGLLPGDRGGVEGAEDDVKWLHFVPRMVAYNWSNENQQIIKPGSWLANYKQLLDAFDYQIPEGLNIQVEYADKLLDIQDVKAFQQYASIIEVVLPAPPEEKYQPIALADFAAKRASVPFTCA